MIVPCRHVHAFFALLALASCAPALRSPEGRQGEPAATVRPEGRPVDAVATRSDAPAARITVLRPKPGLGEKFEEGYRRHLEWHRRNRDPWTWLGWSIATGERSGWFVDGTFGHAWGEFDAAVAPAQDAADNASNVAPYADFLSSSVYALRPELSRGDPARVLRSPAVDLASFAIAPGSESLFAEAFGALGHDGRGPAPDALCFELVSGGDRPSFLCLVARTDWRELGLPRPNEPGEAAKRRAVQAWRASVRHERVEALHLRPELGYAP